MKLRVSGGGGRNRRTSVAIVMVATVWIGAPVVTGQQDSEFPVPARRGVIREVLTDFVGRGPVISPDGRYLAYIGTDSGLRVRDLATNVDRRLTPVPPDASRPNGRMAFSPDGKMIAWGWQERPGDHPQLRLVSLDGSALNIPYDSDQWPGVGPWGNWSADGKQILTLAIKLPRSVPHTRRIALVSVADGSILSLKTLPWEANPLGLSLSPDGRFVVYDYPGEEGATDRDLFILPTDGGTDVRLVSRAADDHQPFFAPDGRGVLFMSQRPGSSTKGAWFVPVADGKAPGPPEVLNPDLGPDSTPIGFARNGSFYYRSGSAIRVMERFLSSAASR